MPLYRLRINTHVLSKYHALLYRATKLHQKLYRFLSWRSKQGNENGEERAKVKRTTTRSQWFTKSSVYKERCGENSEISKILKFLRIRVTKEARSRRGNSGLGDFDVSLTEL